MPPENTNPESAPQNVEKQGSVLVGPTPLPTVATSGRRQAFKEIRRELSETDLANPGVQKLLLDELERADADNELLEVFRERYFEADKRAAIFEERLHAVKAMDLLFTVTLTVGGACIGLISAFTDAPIRGSVIAGIGVVLVIGALVGRRRGI